VRKKKMCVCLASPFSVSVPPGSVSVGGCRPLGRSCLARCVRPSLSALFGVSHVLFFCSCFRWPAFLLCWWLACVLFSSCVVVVACRGVWWLGAFGFVVLAGLVGCVGRSLPVFGVCSVLLILRSSSPVPACAGAVVVVVLSACPVRGLSRSFFAVRPLWGFSVSSFSSFVSSLPVSGAVSSPAVRARARAVADLLFSLPGSSTSAVVGVVSVVRSGADSVSVVCSDGRVRVCRVSTASRVLGRPVSVDAVFAKLSARVGTRVVFFAVEGWSPDSWFVGVVGTELLGSV